MPKIGGKRKKARTHQEETPEGDEIIGTIPKSLIFRRGKLNKPLKQIVQDYREIMYPYTAMKLKESEKTKIKDYLQASSVYGMTHMTVLTSTENHNYIRFIKNPEGPTITFKIISYCTRRDIVNANKKNKSFSRQFQPAMLILNGFNKQPAANVRNPPTLAHQQIVAQMVQSMFPPLSLKKTKLSTLQRVILFSYDNEKDIVNMRHYHVSLQPTGVNKNVKKLLKQDKKTPNLSKFNSFSDFVQAKKNISGFASESDAEELPDSKVDVEQKSLLSGNQSFKKQFNIRLHEIGPRLKLRLYKIEEGLLRGNVVYNRRVVKTPLEIETQRIEILAKQLEKEKRKKEQEKRVREKEREANKKEREKAQKRKEKEEERRQRQENGETVEDEEEQEEEESDVEIGSDFEGEDIELEGEEAAEIQENNKNSKRSNKTADSEEELQDLEDELDQIKDKKSKYQDENSDEDDDDEDEEEHFVDEDDDEEEEEDDDEIDEDDDVEEEEDDDEEEEEEIEEPPKTKKFKSNH